MGVIVKLAARLIKMRNLASAPQSQQQAFADETLTIYAPLAARLGIFSVKNELEDLTFKWMNPQAYAELSQTLDQRESIVAALNKLDEELSSRRAQVVDLCGRQKSVYSVYKKMLSKNQKLEDIMDLRAIRIIVADGDNDAESEQTCRETLDIALSTFQSVEGRSKDYIANPKANGYQSLHAVVRDENETTFEIQIRSASMHRTAEFGVAAHWRYKEHEKSATSAKVDQQIQWARFMLTWQNELDDQQKIRPARVAHAVDCGAALRPCISRRTPPTVRTVGRRAFASRAKWKTTLRTTSSPSSTALWRFARLRKTPPWLILSSKTRTSLEGRDRVSFTASRACASTKNPSRLQTHPRRP